MNSGNTIRVAFNTRHENKHLEFDDPKIQRKWWAWYNSKFENMDVTREQFVDLVTRGYGYTTQTSTGYRHSRYFLAGQHFSIDVDDGTTVDELLAHDTVANYAHCIYTTPSHTESAPRLRIVFFLPKAITRKKIDSYRRAAVAMTRHFGDYADTSCKDAARLFFGSKGARVWEIGKTLTFERVKEIVEETEKEEQERQEREAQKYATGSITQGNINPARVAGMRRVICEHIANAPDGEKHNTLFNMSRLAGGLAATGWWTPAEAIAFLYSEIAKRRSVKSLHAALSTIKDAVAIGLEAPVYQPDRYEEREREMMNRAMSGLDAVSPPLTDEQRAQVESVVHTAVKEAHWLGYHKSMTDLAAMMIGLPRNIVDKLAIGRRAETVDENGVIHSESTTIPIRNEEDVVVNVLYVGDDGTVELEKELPSPYPVIIEHDEVVLMLPPHDAVAAATIVCMTPNPPFGVGVQLPVPPSDTDERHTFPVMSDEPRPPHGQYFRTPIPGSELMKHASSVEQIATLVQRRRRT